MRWHQLFADLEAQLEAEEGRDLTLEVADRTRRERAQVGLPERLLGHRAPRPAVRLHGGQVVGGEVHGRRAGLVPARAGERRPDALVPTGCVLARLGPDGGGLRGGRRDDGAAVRVRATPLRGLSRDRAVVALADVSGGAR